MSETENNKTNESAENKAVEQETATVAENTSADTKTKPKKGRGWRFYLKVFSVFFLLMLISFGIAIFYVLNKLASDSNFEKLVNQKASEATGMNINFEKIRVSFPSIELTNIHVATDSAIMKLDSHIASVKVRPDFLAVLRGNIVIDYLGISSSTTLLNMKAIKSTDVAVKEQKSGSSTLDLNSITFPFKSLDINNIVLNYTDEGTKSSYNIKLNRASLSHSLVSSALPYEVDGELVGKAALNAKGDLYWPSRVTSDVVVNLKDINEVKQFVPEEYKKYLNSITGSNARASIDYNITNNSVDVKSYNIGVEPILKVSGTAAVPQMTPLKLQASATLSPVEVSDLWPIIKDFVPPEHGIALKNGAIGADVGVSLDGDKPIQLRAVVQPKKVEISTKYVEDKIVLQKGNFTYGANNTIDASDFEVSLADTSVKLMSLKLALNDLNLNAVFGVNIGIEGLIKNLKQYLGDAMKNLALSGNISMDGNINGKLSDISSLKLNGSIISKIISIIENKTKAQGRVENLNIRLNGIGAETGTINVESLNVSATGADLNVKGTIKNQKDIGFDCSADGGINVGEFSKLASGLFNLPVKEGQYKGQLDVSLKVGGTVKDPKPFGKIVAKDIYADVSKYGIVINKFNGTVTADNDKLVLNNIKANALGGDLDFNGTIKDFKNMKVEAVANVKGTNLAMVRKLIGAFVPDMPAELDFSGNADLNASLIGPTSAPKIKGTAQLKDVRFIHPMVFRPVEKINGRINFNNDGLSSESLTAYWGTSKANVSGSLKDWAKFITNFKFNVAPLDVTDAAGFFLEGTGFKVLGTGIGSGTVTGALEEIKVDCFAKVDVGTVTALITEGGESMKFPYQKLSARATYFNNALDVSSASFKLFDGDIKAKSKITLVASEPIRYDVDANINQLQTQEFLKVNADKKYEKTLVGGLDGFAKFKGDSTGLNSINGDAHLQMASGTYDSPDIIKSIAEKLKNPSLASGTINNVSGDYKIANGRISSNNTMGTSQDSSVVYRGSVGLDTTLDGALDFSLGKETCSKSSYMKDLLGSKDKLSMTCKVKGSLTSPKIDLPLDDLLKQKAKNELNKLLGKDKDKEGGEKKDAGKVVDKIGEGVSKLGKSLKKIFK
ncbi:MAG: hypothetical protein II567_03760 [Candidatus Riflebacteria bacterium]|nr:hypothetical protein [Candidatus Riflebacteria bacterium]